MRDLPLLFTNHDRYRCPMRIRVLLALLVLVISAHAADVHVRVDPSARPANPGNENLTVFPTIVNALDHHPFATPNPDGTPGRVFIEIAPGTYHERVIVTQNHNNITLLGMGKSPEDVVITNSLNAKQAGGSQADNTTFENAAGNTGQAVAAVGDGDGLAGVAGGVLEGDVVGLEAG